MLWVTWFPAFQADAASAAHVSSCCAACVLTNVFCFDHHPLHSSVLQQADLYPFFSSFENTVCVLLRRHSHFATHSVFLLHGLLFPWDFAMILSVSLALSSTRLLITRETILPIFTDKNRFTVVSTQGKKLPHSTPCSSRPIRGPQPPSENTKMAGKKLI